MATEDDKRSTATSPAQAPKPEVAYTPSPSSSMIATHASSATSSPFDTSKYFSVHPPNLETSGFLIFPRTWSGIETGPQLAQHLAGPDLPSSSAWRWGSREREFERLVTSRAWKRGAPTPPVADAYYLPWIDRDVRRERLPIIARALHASYFKDRKQQRELAALSWIYGRALGWGEYATVKQLCKPLYDYAVQRAKAVGMVAHLLTVRGVVVGSDCAHMMREWDRVHAGLEASNDEERGSANDDGNESRDAPGSKRTLPADNAPTKKRRIV
ncbi:hypothetical protein Q8F55_001660 [Vanrija albida]|uniref:Opioid growth factor receptor (OGFr) conserved domain-containing protein n=1 Tax=Vanrija albida TaxID=181172 RepID=A0ABR3Q8P3_9TREE